MRALALIALVAVPAAAQTVYSWEDAEGVHFTDDLNQVPKEARQVEAQQLARAPASKAQPVAAATASSAAPAVPLDEQAWRERFVAATRRISTLQQSIRALEASLPPRTECVTQAAVAPITAAGAGGPTTILPGPSTAGVTTVAAPRFPRCQLNPLHDQMKAQLAQEQVRLKDAELDLEQLERNASYAGVPREWRRGW